MNNPYMGNPTKALPFKEGYLVGIKEVVAWVDKNWLDQSNMKQWQSKLKEWGIEQ